MLSHHEGAALHYPLDNTVRFIKRSMHVAPVSTSMARKRSTAATQSTSVCSIQNMNKSKKGDNSNNNDPWASMEAELATQGPSENILQLKLTKTRKSFQLQLKECGIRCPLPNDIFNLQSGAASDGVKVFECHGEETLISLDLLESDLSGCVKAGEGGENKIGVYAPLPKKAVMVK